MMVSSFFPSTSASIGAATRFLRNFLPLFLLLFCFVSGGVSAQTYLNPSGPQFSYPAAGTQLKSDVVLANARLELLTVNAAVDSGVTFEIRNSTILVAHVSNSDNNAGWLRGTVRFINCTVTYMRVAELEIMGEGAFVLRQSRFEPVQQVAAAISMSPAPTPAEFAQMTNDRDVVSEIEDFESFVQLVIILRGPRGGLDKNAFGPSYMAGRLEISDNYFAPMIIGNTTAFLLSASSTKNSWVPLRIRSELVNLRSVLIERNQLSGYGCRRLISITANELYNVGTFSVSHNILSPYGEINGAVIAFCAYSFSHVENMMFDGNYFFERPDSKLFNTKAIGIGPCTSTLRAKFIGTMSFSFNTMLYNGPRGIVFDTRSEGFMSDIGVMIAQGNVITTRPPPGENPKIHTMVTPEQNDGSTFHALFFYFQGVDVIRNRNWKRFVITNNSMIHHNCGKAVSFVWGATENIESIDVSNNVVLGAKVRRDCHETYIFYSRLQQVRRIGDYRFANNFAHMYGPDVTVFSHKTEFNISKVKSFVIEGNNLTHTAFQSNLTGRKDQAKRLKTKAIGITIDMANLTSFVTPLVVRNNIVTVFGGVVHTQNALMIVLVNSFDFNATVSHNNLTVISPASEGVDFSSSIIGIFMTETDASLHTLRLLRNNLRLENPLGCPTAGCFGVVFVVGKGRGAREISVDENNFVINNTLALRFQSAVEIQVITEDFVLTSEFPPKLIFSGQGYFGDVQMLSVTRNKFQVSVYTHFHTVSTTNSGRIHFNDIVVAENVLSLTRLDHQSSPFMFARGALLSLHGFARSVTYRDPASGIELDLEIVLPFETEFLVRGFIIVAENQVDARGFISGIIDLTGGVVMMGGDVVSSGDNSHDDGRRGGSSGSGSFSSLRDFYYSRYVVVASSSSSSSLVGVVCSPSGAIVTQNNISCIVPPPPTPLFSLSAAETGGSELLPMCSLVIVGATDATSTKLCVVNQTYTVSSRQGASLFTSFDAEVSRTITRGAKGSTPFKRQVSRVLLHDVHLNLTCNSDGEIDVVAATAATQQHVGSSKLHRQCCCGVVASGYNDDEFFLRISNSSLVVNVKRTPRLYVINALAWNPRYSMISISHSRISVFDISSSAQQQQQSLLHTLNTTFVSVPVGTRFSIFDVDFVAVVQSHRAGGGNDGGGLSATQFLQGSLIELHTQPVSSSTTAPTAQQQQINVKDVAIPPGVHATSYSLNVSGFRFLIVQTQEQQQQQQQQQQHTPLFSARQFQLVGFSSSSAATVGSSWYRSGEVGCCYFNNEPVKGSSASSTFYDAVALSLHRVTLNPCPRTPTLTRTVSISEVPFCSSFVFVPQAAASRLIVDDVAGESRQVRWYIMLADKLDTPAPLAAGGRIVPAVDLIGDLGKDQSDPVTHFRSSLGALRVGLLQTEADLVEMNASLASSFDILIVPPLFRQQQRDGSSSSSSSDESSSDDGDASSSSSSSSSSYFPAATQTPSTSALVHGRVLSIDMSFAVELDPDVEHTVRILVSAKLLACRARSNKKQLWTEATITVKPRFGYLSLSVTKSALALGNVAAILLLPADGALVAGTIMRAKALKQTFMCKHSKVDRPLELIESPLGMTVGNRPGKFLKGAIAGNIVVLVLCSVVLIGVAAARVCFAAAAARLSFYDALGMSMFPSLLFIPVNFLTQGTISSATGLIYLAPSESWFYIILGFFVFVGMLFLVLYVVFFQLPRYLVAPNDTEEQHHRDIIISGGVGAAANSAKQQHSHHGRSETDKSAAAASGSSSSSASCGVTLRYEPLPAKDRNKVLAPLPPSTLETILKRLFPTCERCQNESVREYVDELHRSATDTVFLAKQQRRIVHRPSFFEEFMDGVFRRVFFVIGRWVVANTTTATTQQQQQQQQHHDHRLRKQQEKLRREQQQRPRGDPYFLTRYSKLFASCHRDARFFPLFSFFVSILIGVISGVQQYARECSQLLMFVMSVLVCIIFVTVVSLRPQVRNTATLYLIITVSVMFVMCVVGLIANFQDSMAAFATLDLLLALVRYISSVAMFADLYFIGYLRLSPFGIVVRSVWNHYVKKHSPVASGAGRERQQMMSFLHDASGDDGDDVVPLREIVAPVVNEQKLFRSRREEEEDDDYDNDYYDGILRRQQRSASSGGVADKKQPKIKSRNARPQCWDFSSI